MRNQQQAVEVSKASTKWHGPQDAPVVRARLIGFIGTWFHGRLGGMSMALAGLIMIGIHMIWVDSLDSDYGNLLVGIYHECKTAVRVYGELVVASSQLYQLDESDGTSSEVDQLN
ncbi:hypothetical protein F2Q70_00026011 [Brassica cretica]|uniref:Uncharacterized protein n=1 Tax=Brassica cretica TaxID=69181 RepID=A0A8S9LJQ2_BRACR|nr:hypothetical protein F2Q68_00025500 [Brassica cretica]KAF2605678.1 hypothetical protein F2Q70_00026011 [Brassica cretica]